VSTHTPEPIAGAAAQAGAAVCSHEPQTSEASRLSHSERDRGGFTEKGDARAERAAAESVSTAELTGSARTRITSSNASEMARRSNEARRAKREAREREAELNKLTLRGRVATVASGRATAEEIGAVLTALLDGAKAGKVTYARELRAWLGFASDLDQADSDTPADGADLSSLTPEQRAALRADLIARARAAAADAAAVESEHITSQDVLTDES